VADTLAALDAAALERFLDRRRAHSSLTPETHLGKQLLEVLRRANDFVPSEAGSILLDDPLWKVADPTQNALTFVAAFGRSAAPLIGQTIPASVGIAGHVYQTGNAYRSTDVRQDRHFYAGVDAETSYRTECILAVPVLIEQQVCGVLELLNRAGDAQFSERDLQLLQIFAGYISISIQNILDGRRAHEIARRDNLTGLFNDRYLHQALERELGEAQQTATDLSLLFLDLDFFKRVNDSHGHLAGSQTLREVGELLREILTDEPPGWIAARYGGDEFVIVLPGRGIMPAVNLAERIRTAIARRSFLPGGGSIFSETLNLRGLTCSIGVASLRRHLRKDLSLEQAKSSLLKLADGAMYVAKDTGRNQTAVAGKTVRRTD
jgi:diguanylate cyclase (GGDEF)-like protein